MCPLICIHTGCGSYLWKIFGAFFWAFSIVLDCSLSNQLILNMCRGITEESKSIVPKMKLQEKNKAVVTSRLCAGSTVKELFCETSQRSGRGKSGTFGLLALPPVILWTILCQRFSITCNPSPLQHWKLSEAEDHGAGGKPRQGHHDNCLLGILSLGREGGGG
jgi:hypothetical protein